MLKPLQLLITLILFSVVLGCSKAPGTDPKKILPPPVDTGTKANVSTTFGSNGSSWITNIHNINLGGNSAPSMATDAGGNVFVMFNPYGIFDADPGAATIIAGSSAKAYSAVLVKYDPAGKFIWMKQFSTAGAINRIKLITDNQGNIYCSMICTNTPVLQFGGDTYSLKNATSNIIIKFNNQGQKQWVKEIGTSYDQFGMDGVLSIAADGDGNLYVVGMSAYSVIFYNYNGDNSFTLKFPIDQPYYFLAKYDATGKLLFNKPLVPFVNAALVPGYQHTYFAVDKNENVYIAGETEFIPVNGQALIGDDLTNDEGGFITKYDKDGNWIWFKGVKFSVFYEINSDADGNIYTSSGTTTLFETNVLTKTDPNGNDLWTNTVNRAVDNISTKIAFDKTGNVLYMGECIYANDPRIEYSNAIYLNKYTPGGATIYTNILTGYHNVSHVNLSDALIDNSGNIDMVGGYVSSLKLLGTAGDPIDPPNDYDGGIFIAHFPDKAW